MSWDQLLSIRAEQVAEAEQARIDARQPLACPNDGEPMTTDAAGRLVCPYDGWRPGP